MTTPYETYKQIRKETGWAVKIANKFGWKWSDILSEYESRFSKWADKLQKKHEKKLKQAEQKFIDEILTDDIAEWARKRRIAYLINNNPQSVELEILINKREPNGITDEMIARAKEHPITEILGEPTRGKYNCIWHDDKNPSMHYYEKTNSVHCFSCGKGGDSIDVAMTVYNIEFLEAVKNLA